MSEYQVRGPEHAQLLAVSGWRRASGVVEAWPAGEVARLNTPALAFETPTPQRIRSGIAMSGAYNITFDVSQHAVPTTDTHRTYQVEPYLYIVTRREYDTLRPLAYDPVPSAPPMGRKLKMIRAKAGEGLVTVTAQTEAEVTFEIAAGYTVDVVRLMGRVVGDRWYWSECDPEWA